MKDIIRCLVILLFVFFACQNTVAVEAAVNEDNSVTINAENFPDERFREVALYLDKDKNNVLSLAERKVLQKIKITCCSYNTKRLEDMDSWVQGKHNDSTILLEWAGRDTNSKLSVQGIEYFPELKSYHVQGFFETEGSLKKNKKLRSVTIQVAYGLQEQVEEMVGDLRIGNAGKIKLELKSCSKLEKVFPMKQLATMKIGLHCKKINLASASNLKHLELGVKQDDYDYIEIGQVDVSKNKKLKKLVLRNVKTKVVDLRKNKKLEELYVVGGGGYQEYFPHEKMHKLAGREYSVTLESCKFKFPKNNKIKKIEYMACFDNNLDLSSCKKLTSLRILDNVQVKLNRKWYQKTGKNKLKLYIRGSRTKAQIQKKTKKFVYIKAKDLLDRSETHDRLDCSICCDWE